MKIRAFCSPKPGRALIRRSTARPRCRPCSIRPRRSPPYSLTSIRHSSCTRLALAAGKRCRAGGSMKMATSLSGSMAARSLASRAAAEPVLQVERGRERPFEGDLLVEHHPDQEGERIIGYEAGRLRGSGSDAGRPWAHGSPPVPSPLRSLGGPGVGVDPVGRDGLVDLGRLRLTDGSQPVEHRHRHVGGVGLEMAAERLPRVGSAKSIGTERDVRRGTQRAIWSGTAFIKSVTATMGPAAPSSDSVTYGWRGGRIGCSRFQRSTEGVSRRVL